MPTQSTGAKQYTDALLNTMDALAKITVKSSKDKTLTLEAKIVEIVDEGLGKYKVQYLDNIFTAFSANASIKYKVDTIVYIIVPEGNFDKKITILSDVASEDSKLMVTEGDLYIKIGDSLFGNVFSTNLCSRRVENNELKGNKSFFGKTFTEYLKDNRTFSLTCNIRTDIDVNRRSNGNYGLVLNIPVVDLNNISSNYEVVLDINNIMGNAYNFNVKALQNLYFTLPEDLSFDSNNLGNLSLTAFVKDFPGQDPIDPETGAYIGDRIIDIWISDIGVYPVKVVSRNEKEGYFLKARATEGSLFWGGSASSKELYPDLYLDGRPTSADPFDCYWFKENYRIGVRSPGWHQYGGVGWQILNKKKIINETETGEGNYEYEPQQRYGITIKEVHSDLRYKCVLVSKSGDTILTDIITIRNIVDPATFILTTENGSTVFTKGIPNSKAILVVKYSDSDLSDDSSLQYEFKRFNQYGQLIDDKDPNNDKKYKENIFKLESPVANEKTDENGITYLVTKFSIPVKEIYDMNTIYCTAYKSQINTAGDEVSSEVVATASIGLSTAKAPSFQVILENADKVYKYDIDGDSPMVANYDGPISSKIKAITPISARAYKDTGEEFDENEYNVSTITWKVPKNSMIQFEPDDLEAMRIMQPSEDATGQYYIISGPYPQLKDLYYSIATVYSRNKSENTIRANIKMSNLSIDGLATIKFLKDGESGTAGSKFAAVITHGPSSKDSKAYEEIEYVEVTDEQGQVTRVEKIHKLQLICVDVQDQPVKWYMYNSATDEYVEFTSDFNDNPDLQKEWTQFFVQMYCDGEPLSQNGYSFETKWEIFDSDNIYTNVVSPIWIDSGTGIIYIKYEDETDPSKGLIKWPEPRLEDNEKIPRVCAATIAVSCQAVKDSQDTTNDSMFEKRIRAYYPIEVTYSKSMDIINQKLIPRLNGGFNQVVYDTEGKNPSYNSNQTFTFEDQMPKNAADLNQGYTWSSSESIILEDVKDDAGDPIPLEKRATPTARRFPDGNGCQYVKVDYGYNTSPEVIDPELDDLYELKNEIETNYRFNFNMNNAASIIRDYESVYNQLKLLINSNDNLLLFKQQLIEFFMMLQLEINILQDQHYSILSDDGKEYFDRFTKNNVGVYKILLAASERMGEKNYTIQMVQNLFLTYGALQICDLESGHYNGVYIDKNYNFYKPGTTKQKKQSFKNAINNFNVKIQSMYGAVNTGYYYTIINDTGSAFSTAFDIFRHTQDCLNGYYEDLILNGNYTESGSYTYVDEFTGLDVSRWEVLTQEFAYVHVEDGEREYDFTIENPYYEIFNPIYNNLDVIISNMKEAKFKSYMDIINVLDSIYDQLSLYFNFDLIRKMDELELEKLKVLNDISGLELLKDNYNVSSLIHVKPIIMLLNPTATWLDWDGNKIKINEEGAYIAAPMFAAGRYEKTGGFTGLTLGVQREEVDKKSQRVGLLGHYDGKQSIFLDATTGKAEFGLVETGQIIIDPSSTKLQIYDSYYTQEPQPGQDPSGMCISFAEKEEGGGTLPGYIHFKGPGGKIYSGQHNTQDSDANGFYLSHDGFSIGANVHINQNGTFTFGDRNKTNGKYIEWNGSTFEIGNQVKVTASAINADSTITCGGTTPTFIVDGKTGNLSAGSGNFKVSGNGNVEIGGSVEIGTSGSGNIKVNGILTAREESWIGNWKVAENGKLLGYQDSSNIYNDATIRLDPQVWRIGFATGAKVANGTKNEFVYIGGGKVSDNADDDRNILNIYTNNSDGSDMRFGGIRGRSLFIQNLDDNKKDIVIKFNWQGISKYKKGKQVGKTLTWDKLLSLA